LKNYFFFVPVVPGFFENYFLEGLFQKKVLQKA